MIPLDSDNSIIAEVASVAGIDPSVGVRRGLTIGEAGPLGTLRNVIIQPYAGA